MIAFVENSRNRSIVSLLNVDGTVPDSELYPRCSSLQCDIALESTKAAPWG